MAANISKSVWVFLLCFCECSTRTANNLTFLLKHPCHAYWTGSNNHLSAFLGTELCKDMGTHQRFFQLPECCLFLFSPGLFCFFLCELTRWFNDGCIVWDEPGNILSHFNEWPDLRNRLWKFDVDDCLNLGWIRSCAFLTKDMAMECQLVGWNDAFFFVQRCSIIREFLQGHMETVIMVSLWLAMDDDVIWQVQSYWIVL